MTHKNHINDNALTSLTATAAVLIGVLCIAAYIMDTTMRAKTLPCGHHAHYVGADAKGNPVCEVNK